ncbi:MAG TPA: YdeI/OmpD-associated family protein [Pyrinomonadaceae bacterium]|nr:YdeI/OmpD-associated family protein [Pyrinomonadaceae bacterium]
MPRFSSSIYKIGINPVVDPPDSVMSLIFEQAGKSAGPIPVRGTLNGAGFIQTLVKYRGAWRLYINGPMLKRSGLKVGDTATIEIEFDPNPREVPIQKKLADALSEDAGAKAVFEKLPPSRRKEILKYLSSLKTQAAVDRNVERVMRNLRGE